MRSLEKEKNKWFIDKEMEQVEDYKRIEQEKQRIKRQKELENRDYVADQIGMSYTLPSIAEKHNQSERDKIGKYGSRGMNEQEYMFNRQLLLEINQKKKLMKHDLTTISKPGSRGEGSIYGFQFS